MNAQDVSVGGGVLFQLQQPHPGLVCTRLLRVDRVPPVLGSVQPHPVADQHLHVYRSILRRTRRRRSVKPSAGFNYLFICQNVRLAVIS